MRAISAACAIALAMMGACARRSVAVAPARAAPLNDNSYTDLKPGWKLRAVMPLTRDGGLRAAAVSREGEGGTIFVSPGDVDGYQTLYYAVEAGRHGQVRLRFVSAEATREGKTVGERGAPAQPFRLPRGSAHVQLIYLIRASQSDHDMAIVASRWMEDLNAFTGRLKANPEICTAVAKVFCSWVPAGVALRPESQ